MQRSLTVIINKKLAGVQEEGYPHTYYGRNEFSFGGITYPAIGIEQMAAMPVMDYLSRLTAFKLYVEILEAGLDIDTDTVEGCEAYRQNLTACPVGIN